MSEMVERVARAISAALAESYAEREEPSEEDHQKAARAAIQAMREPTDAMCDAADWRQQSEVNQYQLAIDAALGKTDA